MGGKPLELKPDPVALASIDPFSAASSKHHHTSRAVKHIEDDPVAIEKMLEEFFTCEKLFLILTNSGKPIYSSQGDIYQLSPIIATLYAMIAKIQTIESLVGKKTANVQPG